MKTNLEMLVSSIKKARNENMKIIKSGEVEKEDFIIVHNDKGYVVKVENSEIVSCNCGHCQISGQICKHMLFVSMNHFLNIKALNIGNEQCIE